MYNDLMDSIEPYNYDDLKPFSKAYLTGYLADKYDVSAKDDAKNIECKNEKYVTTQQPSEKNRFLPNFYGNELSVEFTKLLK